MHPYLPHLLSDIAKSHREDDPQEKESPPSFEEHIKDVERYIAGEKPDHTFGYYCGLEAKDFPPPEQFTDEEIAQVYKAFEKLLFSWNAGMDLPEELPPQLRYKFMVNTLSEGFTPLSSGMIHFDYCTGYAPDCVFGKYCPCLEYWNENSESND